MYTEFSKGIHPTALIAPGAKLGSDVRVGPYAIIGDHVELGDGVVIHPHAIVDGHTTLGPQVEVYPHAAVGLPPQDRKHDGSPTTLVVGKKTVIRESATLQPGTAGSDSKTTVIGEDCLLMAYVHVAHDCVVGNNVIIANGTQIAGHVTIDDHAVLGGVTTIHQFVRIGTRAITGASSRVVQDVPPFTTADGHPASLVGVNSVGLDRAGVSKEAVIALRRAYRIIFMRGPFKESIAEVEAGSLYEFSEVQTLCAFLSGGTRGVTRARRKTA